MTTGYRLASHLRSAARQVYAWLQNRWVRWAIQVLVLAFCLFYLVLIREQIQALMQDIQPNYAALALSWLAVMIGVYLGVVSWTWTLAGLGQPVNWLAYGRAQLFANLAKYLPGYAWQFLGKAYLTSQAGVPGAVIGLGMLLEFASLVLVGMLIALVYAPLDLIAAWIGYRLSLESLQIFRVLLCLACLGGLLLAPPVILNRAVRRGLIQTWRAWPLWGMLGAVLMGWFCLCFSFWSLEWVFQPANPAHLPIFMFTMAASFLVGLVVIIVPNSLGIREGMMVLLLGPLLAWPLPVLIAAASRFVLVVSELLGALTVVFVDWVYAQKRQ
jgi:hypothetical protein